MLDASRMATCDEIWTEFGIKANRTPLRVALGIASPMDSDMPELNTGKALLDMFTFAHQPIVQNRTLLGLFAIAVTATALTAMLYRIRMAATWPVQVQISKHAAAHTLAAFIWRMRQQVRNYIFQRYLILI